MTSRQSRFVLPVLLALLIVLPGCRDRDQQLKGTPPPLTISLAYNQGQCTQNGSAGVIDVEEGQNVTYQGPSTTTGFNVAFSSCPFASGKCPANSPQGASQDMGTPTASAVNNTFYYSGVTIGTQTCNNGVQSWGVHVKPGTGLMKK